MERPIKTLERVLSKAGLASRTGARKIIEKGRVKVNGRVVRDPDQWIDLELDRVMVDGAALESSPRVYLLMNKPPGYLATHKDKAERPTVYDLLPPDLGFVSSVGRLDLETSGLLILTNDTQMAERLTNPKYKVPKTYRVTTSIKFSEQQFEQLRAGIELSDGLTLPALVTPIGVAAGTEVFEITITEGRNRQVRRMVEALGGAVVALTRVKIAAISLDGLAEGAVRKLSESEVAELMGSSRA